MSKTLRIVLVDSNNRKEFTFQRDQPLGVVYSAAAEMLNLFQAAYLIDCAKNRSENEKFAFGWLDKRVLAHSVLV